MTIPPEVVPSDVQALLDELHHRDYLTNRIRYEEGSFGDSVVVLQKDRTFVRLVRDRGQWFIEVAGAPVSDWFSPIVWRALFESSMPSLETASFDAQAELLRVDLSRIEATNERIDDSVLAELRAWRSHRAQARRGLPPPA